jgi:hypothetical protein
MFVSEQGVPLRVVTSSKLPNGQSKDTIEVQAVNVPVNVKAPPRRRTISQKQFEKLIVSKSGAAKRGSRGKSGTEPIVALK